MFVATRHTQTERKRSIEVGRASKKLHAKLSQVKPSDLPTGKMPRQPELPDMEAWIREGMDPVHAAYAFFHYIATFFAEETSCLPEMKKFAALYAKAEDEYQPSGPPMSPLTTSFFSCWALFDLQFDDGDTLASCLIESNDVVCMNPDQLDILKKMAASRMGIYEHVGMDGEHVRLRELVTNVESICHSASGYLGKSGELWYVRLLPPIVPALARYHIVFTTPYILMASKNDWLEYLGRAIPGSGKDATAMNRFCKYGPTLHYWNEFVFKAYHHHQSDAIFLAGIPDLKATLPHAD
jgi:hypothetical protein